MTTTTRQLLGRLRLQSQLVSPTRPEFTSPVDVVRWMTAIQAQDFLGAKWAVGLRLPGSTDDEIVAALADRSIVRSWPMRGTLHFVTAEDLHWMLELTRERMIKRSASNFAGEGLTTAVLERVGDGAGAALAGGRTLTRDALYEVLAECGVSTVGQARYHALWYLCQIGLLCMGPPQGKSQTFVLLDEWVPRPRRLERDEALGEFALRYFRSHGPATDRDFSWWSSLTLTEARVGLAGARQQLESLTVDAIDYYFSPGLPEEPEASATRLLPGFDEYLLGYTDRSVALTEEHAPLVFPGKNGMFLPTIVVDGAVAGVWKRTSTSKKVTFDLQPFTPLTAREASSVHAAAEEYAKFVGLEPSVPA
ncbi:MAG TPA: winged helix DNA-binding domain-containing protein [Homoserinimonas sp.]|nr:winged helix DNA-binding domain-containing protein [Homoserinimonas sp.]